VLLRLSALQLGATSLAGWGAGYAVVREIGPILISLMFSGRVGANNTAELATMTVTEQLDGLRALAIDPVRFLVVPRVIAMVDEALRTGDEQFRTLMRGPRVSARTSAGLPRSAPAPNRRRRWRRSRPGSAPHPCSRFMQRSTEP